MENTRRKRIMKGRKRKIRQLLKCVTVRRGFWPGDLLHGFLHIFPLFALLHPRYSSRWVVLLLVDVYISYTFLRVHIVDFEVGGPSADRYVDITYGYLIFHECILISKLRRKRYS